MFCHVLSCVMSHAVLRHVAESDYTGLKSATTSRVQIKDGVGCYMINVKSRISKLRD